MPASKFTPAIRNIIIETIREGKSQKAAARRARIADLTIRNWLKLGQSEDATPTQKKFYDDFQDALQEAIEKWEAQFQRGDVQTTVETITASNGETIVKKKQTITRKADHAWKWLQARFPDEYQQVTESDDEDKGAVDLFEESK